MKKRLVKKNNKPVNPRKNKRFVFKKKLKAISNI